MASPPSLPPIASRQLWSIQLCRGAAAWLVVFYHLAKLGDRRWSTTDGRPNFLRWFELFGFAGVDLFFVISGVVMMVTCWRRLGDARQVAPFLKRRAARIYPQYWVCTAAVLAICWWAPYLVPPGKTEPWFVLKSLALWPQREMPVVTVAWTLTYEMCFYLAFAALIALPRRWALPALAAWAIAILATGAIADDATRRLLDVPAVFPPLAPLALEFIVGCGIGVAASLRFAESAEADSAAAHQRTLPLGRTALALGVAVFVGLGVWSNLHYVAGGTDWTRVSVFGLGSALIIYGAIGCEIAGAKPASHAWTFWGDASYSLYLTHGYVIQAFGLLYARWPAVQNGPGKLGLTVACLAAVAAVAAGCHVGIERPLNAKARRLLDAKGETPS